MAQVVQIAAEIAPEDDGYVVLVEQETEAHHQVVEFDRDSARFAYGPRSFDSCAAAVRQACHWADQYGIARVYVH